MIALPIAFTRILCCNQAQASRPASSVNHPHAMTVSQAFRRALDSLAQPAVLWHFIWPVLLSAALWVAIAAGVLGAFDAGALAQHLPPSVTPDARAFLAGLGRIAFVVLVLVLLFPFIYVTSVVITGTIAVPLMVVQVARREYATLERKRGGGVIGSAFNALAAVLIFVLLLVTSLPLYLLPFAGLAVSIVLTAWLNKKIYQYDALMDHASTQERALILRRHRAALWKIALTTSALVLVPVVNFFAPAFAGLVFVHFCLGSLAELRAIAPQPQANPEPNSSSNPFIKR